MIESYDKLPVGIYMEIVKLYEEEMEDFDRILKVISLLSGKPENELLKMPIADFTVLAGKARFVEGSIPQKKGIAKEYRLGDMTLVATRNVTDMTTAQYVDFQTVSAMGRDKIVEMLAVFLVPKGMDYLEGYDIAEVQSAIGDNLSVTDATALLAFFLNSSKTLMQLTLTYLRVELWRMRRKRKMAKERMEQMTEQISQLQTALQESGDGWTMCARWLQSPISLGRMFGE